MRIQVTANQLLGAAVLGCMSHAALAQESDGSRRAAVFPQLEEVVVTAQKQSQNLLDVPVAVGVVAAETLMNSNRVDLASMASQIPNLTVNAGNIAIRGLTAGGGQFSNPTVSFVMDDVPTSGSTANTGILIPEIDPADLRGVEVLRGPQGTLYGASALGGLIKYVTLDPSMDRFSSKVTAGLTSIADGDDLGYNASAAVNVPLGDTFAVRVSGFSRESPGYIDNPVLGLKDVNSARKVGARLSALWKPSEDFSIKLGYLYQQPKLGGSDTLQVLPGYGTPAQNMIYHSNRSKTELEIYSANINATLGNADLVLATSYSTRIQREDVDQSDGVGSFIPLTETVFGLPPGVTQADLGIIGRSLYDGSKFSQEVRLTVPVAPWLDWLVGGFYTREKFLIYGDFWSAVRSTGTLIGAPRMRVKSDLTWLGYEIFNDFQELAGFTNFTFRPTEKLNIQLGGRFSDLKSDYDGLDFGYIYGAPIFSPAKSTDSAFTFLVTPQYRFNDDMMAYVRAASGFRPGGPNANSSLGGAPPAYQPDKIVSYEVGFKGQALEGSLSYDLSAFVNDWTDMQLGNTLEYSPGLFLTFTDNAGKSRSQGLEATLQARITSGLSLGAWFAYTDAKLVDGFPVGATSYGVKGDRLPDAPQYSGNVTIDQSLMLSDQVTGTVGLTVNYIGERLGQFNATSATPRFVYDSYTTLDLRAVLEYQSWTLALFATNLTNEFKQTSEALTGTYQANEPRLIGMNLTKEF